MRRKAERGATAKAGSRRSDGNRRLCYQLENDGGLGYGTQGEDRIGFLPAGALFLNQG